MKHMKNCCLKDLEGSNPAKALLDVSGQIYSKKSEVYTAFFNDSNNENWSRLLIEAVDMWQCYKGDTPTNQYQQAAKKFIKSWKTSVDQIPSRRFMIAAECHYFLGMVLPVKPSYKDCAVISDMRSHIKTALSNPKDFMETDAALMRGWYALGQCYLITGHNFGAAEAFTKSIRCAQQRLPKCLAGMNWKEMHFSVPNCSDGPSCLSKGAWMGLAQLCLLSANDQKDSDQVRDFLENSKHILQWLLGIAGDPSKENELCNNGNQTALRLYAATRYRCGLKANWAKQCSDLQVRASASAAELSKDSSKLSGQGRSRKNRVTYLKKGYVHPYLRCFQILATLHYETDITESFVKTWRDEIKTYPRVHAIMALRLLSNQRRLDDLLYFGHIGKVFQELARRISKQHSYFQIHQEKDCCKPETDSEGEEQVGRVCQAIHHALAKSDYLTAESKRRTKWRTFLSGDGTDDEQKWRRLFPKGVGDGEIDVCGAVLCFLRDYSSDSPLLNKRDQETAVGGGYYLRTKDTGIVIDPGSDFLAQYYRQLCGLGFGVSDIHKVLVTHSHMDHIGDLEAITVLAHRAREFKRLRKGNELLSEAYGNRPEWKIQASPDKKTPDINLFLNLGAMQKCSGWLDFKSIVYSVNPLQPGSEPDLTRNSKSTKIACKVFGVKHDEVISATHSVGLILHIKKRGKTAQVAVTSDSTWQWENEKSSNVTTLAKEIINAGWNKQKNRRLLVAHLGSVAKRELEIMTGRAPANSLYTNHLGITGIVLLADALAPELLIVSEFGEEFQSSRVNICDAISVALNANRGDMKRIKVLPASSQLQICLPILLIKCSCCKRFKKPKDIRADDKHKPIVVERKRISYSPHYVCPACWRKYFQES